MPDRVIPETFLPAARSMAFKKSIWEKAGHFPEEYSHNEDYVFARRLKKIGAKIFFVREAVAYWLPRNNFKQAFIMFFRFAFGDAEAGIYRPKIFLIFLRYLFIFSLIIFDILLNSSFILYFICFILILYIIWAIGKNFKYIKSWQALYILPAMQIVSDAAVLSGTTIGLIKCIQIKK